MNKNQIESGSDKLEVVRNTPPTEAGERLLQKRSGRKARKLFDWLYLDGFIDWEGLVCYLWFVILRSLFINLEAFQT